MGGYLPTTAAQRQEMLASIGLSTLEELYGAVPAHLHLKELRLPEGQSELGTLRTMNAMAAKNKVFGSVFRGAGAYRHYIPAIVSEIVTRETLVTAYTPYQAEISQGILQSIFEYQTMICRLTGLAVSNASLYDGASAAAEAVAMCRERKRGKALISAAAHPDVIETVRTYCWAVNTEFALIPADNGLTDYSALSTMLDDTVSCVYLAQPNYYGLLEQAEQVAALAHGKGAKLILGINPVAAAILKTPGECGADIAVGEGQPLGMPLAFGGPYLGFIAAAAGMTRKLPGRIVGETTDDAGNRAFVLTLQAREQHIRREKASSNVCSNQALCAMTASVYMAAMGPKGMKETALQCMSKAHYLAEELDRIGLRRTHTGEFFHEFVTACPDPEKLLRHLEENDILGGLPVEGGILWCATELNSREEMDCLVSLVKEAL
jgi:glycine dehydrogenase subunit 1